MSSQINFLFVNIWRLIRILRGKAQRVTAAGRSEYSLSSWVQMLKSVWIRNTNESKKSPGVTGAFFLQRWLAMAGVILLSGGGSI